MLPEKELLQYIHKTADMGVDGIDSVLNRVTDQRLKAALENRKTQYSQIRQEAADQLNQQGDKPSDANPMAKLSAEMMSAGKLAVNPTPSKIAEMTIQGATMGVTKTIKHLKDYQGNAENVRQLGQRLLDIQEKNVEEMKAFL